MHILHIYKDYAPVIGGVENHVGVLARAQAARGHRVTVLVCDPGGLAGTEVRDGVEIVRARRLFTALSMPVSIHQPMIAARLRPELVHVHSPYPLGELSAWAFRRSTPLVLTYHADVLRQKRALALYAPLLRRVLAAADRIVVTSPPYVETSPWLRPVQGKCRVIPLGVDETRFAPAAAPRSPAQPLLFVGKLRHYKGIDVLLEAIAGLPKQRLDIVGDGPMRAPWEALSKRLGLTDRVRFKGEVDDELLPEVYRAARALILPATSRAEAFGTVLLEAMASGLPCVTTELGTGTSWVVEDGVSGIVVPASDAAALRGALETLSSQPELAATLGRAARRRVEERFTRETMIDNSLALYRELLPDTSATTGRGEGRG